MKQTRENLPIIIKFQKKKTGDLILYPEKLHCTPALPLGRVITSHLVSGECVVKRAHLWWGWGILYKVIKEKLYTLCKILRHNWETLTHTHTHTHRLTQTQTHTHTHTLIIVICNGMTGCISINAVSPHTLTLSNVSVALRCGIYNHQL